MKLRRVYVAAAVALALAAAGCANNEDTNSGSGGAQPSASGSAGFNLDNVKKDDALAQQVDSKISSDGKLVVGTDPTYEPSEFKQNGKIVGFDVDLGDAIAKKLGLTAEFRGVEVRRDPAGAGTRYEIGMSSFTDNPEREKVVDFVTYFSAGTQWASKDPNFNPDNACGKKVAVQTGTVQDTDDLPARQKKCGSNAIQVQRYDAQDEATNSVVLGKADAVLGRLPGDGRRGEEGRRRAAAGRRRLRLGAVRHRDPEDRRHDQGRDPRRGEGADRRTARTRRSSTSGGSRAGRSPTR